MFGLDLTPDAYCLGWLEAQVGKPRENPGFIGEDLQAAWLRGYDDFKAGIPRPQFNGQPVEAKAA